MKAPLAMFILCALSAAAALAQMPAPFTEEDFKKSGHTPIDGDRIRAMLVGNTGYFFMVGENHRGLAQRSQIATYYWRTSNRTVALVIDNSTGKRKTAEQSWWIDDNRYCLRVRTSSFEYLSCRALYDLGGVIYMCGGDQCNQILRIVAGNPEKL